MNRANIEYGLHIADELARWILGQTIVVKGRQLSRLRQWKELMRPFDGLTELVRGRPLTVVKVAKPNQDMRFDVPVIGLETIETMRHLPCHGTLGQRRSDAHV
jgi:DUF1009 family protein